MDIEIKMQGELIFRAGDDQNVLIPMKEEEREQVFGALLDALSQLNGFRPRYLCDATAALKDEHAAETEPNSVAHTGDNVVPLRAPQVAPNEG